jgi:serine/threonine protein kinase
MRGETIEMTTAMINREYAEEKAIEMMTTIADREYAEEKTIDLIPANGKVRTDSGHAGKYLIAEYLSRGNRTKSFFVRRMPDIDPLERRHEFCLLNEYYRNRISVEEPRKALPLRGALQSGAAGESMYSIRRVECCRYFSLEEYIAGEEKIGFDKAMTLISSILFQTSLIHDRGLLHLNLSTENIYVSEFGKHVILLNNDAMTPIGRNAKDCAMNERHFAYRAPELRMPDKSDDVGREADIFSIGAIFFSIIMGRDFNFIKDIIDSHYEWADEMQERCGVFSAGFKESTVFRVIKKSLMASPKNRFHDIHGLLKVLS